MQVGRSAATVPASTRIFLTVFRLTPASLAVARSLIPAQYAEDQGPGLRGNPFMPLIQGAYRKHWGRLNFSFRKERPCG